MGLDWVVLDKVENGRTVEPWETLGARRLSKDDPETVAKFRERYEAQQQRIAPPRKRPWWAFLTREPSDIRREREHREYWGRPFEAVLNEAASRERPPIMIYAAPESEDGLGVVIGGFAERWDFRAQMLESRHNDVIAKTTFDDSRCWTDMEPAEMIAVADDLEAALAAYRRTQDERDADSEAIVEGAVRWLRFWAGKGHPIHAWW